MKLGIAPVAPVAAVAVAILASFLVGSAIADFDYSRLPADPVEQHGRLAAAATSLVEAIALAEEQAGARAHSATANITAEGITYEVVVFTETQRRRFTVGASTGEIMSDKADPPFTLPGEKITGELQELEPGLQYAVLRAGDGPKPAGPGSTVRVHYTGWTVDGKKFDSSLDRGAPANFPLNRVIPGWTKGVGDMQVGEKRKLVIAHELAYGERGRPGIPPKALLIFDVELLEIVSE